MYGSWRKWFVWSILIFKLICLRLSESDINNVLAEPYLILPFSNDKFCISFDKQCSFSFEYNGSPIPIVAQKCSCSWNDVDDEQQDLSTSEDQPSPDK